MNNAIFLELTTLDPCGRSPYIIAEFPIYNQCGFINFILS